MRTSWGICLLGGVTAVAGQARANFISNSGLTPNAKANQYGMVTRPAKSHKQPLNGWTVDGGLDVTPKTYWQTTGTSGYSVDLIGTGGPGSMTQTITGLTAGQTYVLSFDFAPNPEKKTHEQGTTKRLQVDLAGSDLADPAVFSAVADPAATKKNMMYQPETIDFVAQSPSVTLTFSALTPLNIPGHKTVAKLRCGPVISNLDMELMSSGSQTPADGSPVPPSAPVPEPASLGVLAAGGLALLRRRRNG